MIYLLLDEFVGQAELKGAFLGQSISLTGPVAFYAFMIMRFHKWATTEPARLSPIEEIIQEDIDALSDTDKMRRLSWIDGEIKVLKQKQALYESGGKAVPGVEQVTELQVDLADISG